MYKEGRSYEDDNKYNRGATCTSDNLVYENSKSNKDDNYNSDVDDGGCRKLVKEVSGAACRLINSRGSMRLWTVIKMENQ